MPERNIRLLIEYDGAHYAGWQSQPELDTIQDELNTAINQMTDELPSLLVAGRTDAGVHAAGQVATFRTETQIAIHKFAPGLNHYLPDDISIHEAVEAPLAFNPQRDSKHKRYRYRIYRGHQPAALETRAWHIRLPLDLGAMRAAAGHLIGVHDFNAFRSAHCDAAHAVRDMHRIDIIETPRPPSGERIEVVFQANAFCRHMCRILVGTIVEVGMGKRDPESMTEILESKDRTMAGITAPPNGLTLLEVVY